MAGVYRRRARSRVERGARGRRLWIDGTFASYWRPGQVRTGSVWDALGAALLALPPARRRAILLLGLGGGSAARIARALAPRAHILGVEIDPRVVALARRHFALDALGVEVVLADARLYLARARRRFDAILEDVFTGRGRGVHKPEGFPGPGLARAARRLRPGGLLASNALDEAAQTRRLLGERFPALVEISVAGYDNRILVGGPSGLDARRLRAAVAADGVLAPTLPRLAFRSR